MCKCSTKCGCNVTKTTKGDKGDNSLSYTSYVALVSQTGTNNPTKTILENSIGAIVFTYNVAGNYIGTLSGAFPAAKTFLNIQPIKGVTVASITRLTDNTFEIDTVSTNGVLDKTGIEIRVYN